MPRQRRRQQQVEVPGLLNSYPQRIQQSTAESMDLSKPNSMNEEEVCTSKPMKTLRQQREDLQATSPKALTGMSKPVMKHLLITKKTTREWKWKRNVQTRR
jgi:hypothetical protein